MVSDIGNNVYPESQRVSNSEDHDRYLERLRPYQEKVFDRKELLTSEDVMALKTMKNELWHVYGLKKSELYGKIYGVLGFNQVRVDFLEGGKLEEEDRSLCERLRTEELTPEEEKVTSARIDGIRYALDPWHYHRVVNP